MAIDINELRKVLADCYWPTSPVAINELLDRLEAAEKERDKLKELNIALCTKSNSQVIHNARLAEENDALRTENAALVEDMNLLRNNNMTLRAKIEAMEKQEPVATVIKEGDSRYWMSERLWTFPNGKYPLYALPGAQGEEDVCMAETNFRPERRPSA